MSVCMYVCMCPCALYTELRLTNSRETIFKNLVLNPLCNSSRDHI